MDTPPDRFYSPARINAWFAVSSGLVLVGIVAAVLADHYARDWKRHQERFFDLERADARTALERKQAGRPVPPEAEALAGRLQSCTDQELEDTLRDARKQGQKPAGLEEAAAAAASRLQAHADTLRDRRELIEKASVLRAGVKKAEDERFEQEASQRALKSEADARKFERDHALSHGAPESEVRERAEAYDTKVRDEDAVHRKMDAAAKRKEDLAGELKALLAPIAALEGRAAILWDVAGVSGAERKMASFRWEGFREAPFLPPLAPVLKIQQSVHGDLTQDYNFARVGRVDRCVSCHMGIDKVRVDPETQEVTPLYTEKDGVERLFRTHPRPEIYVSSVSSHPLGKMGCTVCHEGNGWGVSDFNAPYHTPNDKAQQERWEKDFGWSEHRHREGWDYPMLPLKHIEASCFQCHRDVERLDPLEKFGKEIPAAAKWNRGMRLFEESGCYGCHKVDGWVVEGMDRALDLKEFKGDVHARSEALAQSMRRAGPALFGVATKWRSPEAAFKWVWRPRELRPTTRMPHFFGQPNNSGVDPLTRVDYDRRTRAEVRGIIHYLWSVAEPLDLREPPANGDAARGKELFGGRGTVGCVACHSTKDFPNPETPGPGNDFAPDLSTVGSKVGVKWLYNWLLDPSHVWPGTRMPKLRLTDQEAADLAAYLVSLRDPEWERGAAAEALASPEVVLELAKEAARVGAASAEEGDARATAASPEERLEMVGKRAIARYGCFGCHEIKGFEGSERIGTELGGGEGWGSKDVDRLDFGLFEDEHAAEHYLKEYAKRWPGGFLPHRKAEWATLKLLNPRVYDAGITKTPDEKLRMPNFGFPEADADALVTFLLSLQRTEIPAARRRILTDREQTVERMKWIARNYNCYGCHTLDRVARVGEDGMPAKTARGRDVRPWLDPDDPSTWPPTLGGEGIHVTAERPSFEDEERIAKAEKAGDSAALAAARRVREEKLRRLNLALEMERKYGTPGWFYGRGSRGEGFKVQPSWFFTFLRDPGKEPLRTWLKIRMPTFPFTPEQANRVVHGFAAADAVPFPFEEPEVEPLAGAHARDAEAVFTGQQCMKCHPVKGAATSAPAAALAPDLYLAPRRLRYDWIVEWLLNPKGLQPGTRMPAFWEGPEDFSLVLNAGMWRRPGFFDGNEDPRVEMRKIAAHVLSLGAPKK